MAGESMDAGGEGFLVVGTVRKPHGIRGELQVTLETDRPREVFRSGRTLSLGDRDGRPIGREVAVDRTRPFKEGLLVQLQGVSDRDAADALRETTFLIPVSEAAPASSDEVPYHLLLGSTVVAGEREIGTVREIVEVGGGETLVIRRPQGRDLLVPFVKAMVSSIDRERRVIVIDPPEGLLDL